MMYLKVPEGWTKCKIGEVVELLTDYVANGSFAAIKENVTYIDSDGYAILLRLQDYSNNFKGEFIYINRESYEFLNKSKVFPGDIIISNVGARCGLSFRAPKLDKPMSLAPNSILLRTNQNDDYIFQFLNSDIGQGKIDMIKGVSAQPKFNKTDFKNIEIMLPTLKEQEKIVEILSTWDSAIEKQEQLIEKKKEFKKGLMQRLLSGEVRFKEFNGKWVKVKLGEIFKERKETGFENLELLAITTANGVVRRTEIDIKDTSSEDKSKYKRILPGDIGYNTMRMWQGVSGLSKYEGIVSPAYTILKPIENIDSLYMSYLFKKPNVINLFYRYSQGLVSDTLNLKYENFKDIKVKISNNIEEQKKISEVLKTADKEIELLEKELEVLKLQKKGLMQRLLTGEVRVKV